MRGSDVMSDAILLTDKLGKFPAPKPRPSERKQLLLVQGVVDDVAVVADNHDFKTIYARFRRLAPWRPRPLPLLKLAAGTWARKCGQIVEKVAGVLQLGVGRILFLGELVGLRGALGALQEIIHLHQISLDDVIDAVRSRKRGRTPESGRLTGSSTAAQTF